MTITEKILASHAKRERAVPGEIVNARIDLVSAHEVTTPPAISMLEKLGIRDVFDPQRIVVTPDHFVPNKDIPSAELAKRLRNWARETGIQNYYEVGRHGICHALLPEQGHVLPGMIVVGADSHSCTYGALGAFSTGIGSTDLAAVLATGELWFKVPASFKVRFEGRLPFGVFSKDLILELIRRIGVDDASYQALEFTGSTLSELSVDARLTITNMAVEAGAKSGIMVVDAKTAEYVRARTAQPFETLFSDADAFYTREELIDASQLEPLVALPPLPSQGRPARELSEVTIDQAYIGSCTNGRIEDLRIAANVLKGRKVASGVRALVVPATTTVWKQAMDEKLFDIFCNAGCVISTPTCGACLGGFMGVLAENEVCISSTNRNFAGRMGHPKSRIYLASPATVAASAVAGCISDPRDFLQ